VRASAAALFLALAACAGAPHGGRSAYTFPEAFDATQAVTVTLEGRTQELIASLSRRGRDFDVTLFDPVFSFPVLTASSRAGVASEVRHTDAVPRGGGERLVQLLAAVYEARYARTEAAGGKATAGAMQLTLEGLANEAACQFPATIEVSSRIGDGPHVRVVTVEATCPEPGEARAR
jgi:hypothetical protein